MDMYFSFGTGAVGNLESPEAGQGVAKISGILSHSDSKGLPFHYCIKNEMCNVYFDVELLKAYDPDIGTHHRKADLYIGLPFSISAYPNGKCPMVEPLFSGGPLNAIGIAQSLPNVFTPAV
ncbi:MAG: hypothetical protein LBT64_00490 [Puniceicoccales bacterium]|jgi:hypothetical protein|nr:hypothetical protein [Puniceicoccales bacterium]